ncbi:DUF397 domain-containing protein [Sphaerisporangium corydalis]|uniref:DUF397 domain-containing protein n=1 Tax=Sphaerisporangium corydalis TaxID=1441875 RepID=A0ABV9EIB8_9ACTN|nr:DUF397 domain-containing protein [Sphaerisporangium corydalis]
MNADLRGAQWRKSALSGDTGNCVEVASNLPGIRAVRDSKNATGPALVFTSSEWSAFLNGVKGGTLSA